MSSERDKAKRLSWQFGMRESAYFMTLMCAIFATVPLGTGLFLLLAPLYLVMFMAMTGKPIGALMILVLWTPIGAFAVFAILMERVAT